MDIKELLNAMFHAYFVITTGITMSMYLCCQLFKPDARLSPVDIGEILLLAFLCDLSLLIFWSRKDLGKKQIALRFCIHVPVITIIVISFAYSWNWVDIKSPLEVFVFILLVLCVYAIAFLVTFYRDKKTANQITEGLKRRYNIE